jgi:WhiB family transcriptional regulator, redox-sensing transcriptional regulator
MCQSEQQLPVHSRANHQQSDERSGAMTRNEVTDVLISSAADSDSVTSTTALVSVEPISRASPADLPCRVQDPDLWFSELPAQLEMAKMFCADCPARIACLTGAIRRREPCGVWGGEIFQHGRIVARKRPRGRPRKVDVAA